MKDHCNVAEIRTVSATWGAIDHLNLKEKVSEEKSNILSSMPYD